MFDLHTSDTTLYVDGIWLQLVWRKENTVWIQARPILEEHQKEVWRKSDVMDPTVTQCRPTWRYNVWLNPHMSTITKSIWYSQALGQYVVVHGCHQNQRIFTSEPKLLKIVGPASAVTVSLWTLMRTGSVVCLVRSTIWSGSRREFALMWLSIPN